MRQLTHLPRFGSSQSRLATLPGGRHRQRAVYITNESIDQLRSQLGLTRAEAQLALHLATGETLRSAAVKFNISYQTARTHLKNISVKPERVGKLNLS